VTDVSGQNIGLILGVKESKIKKPEDGTDRLSRNVATNYHYWLRSNPAERGSQQRRAAEA